MNAYGIGLQKVHREKEVSLFLYPKPPLQWLLPAPYVSLQR